MPTSPTPSVWLCKRASRSCTATGKKDRDYLPPPTLGTLAEIEPALLVTPPAGLEVGYVPIVTRQEAAK